MQEKLLKLSESGIQELDAFFQAVTDQKEPPGLVAIVANKDSICYHKGFGKQNVGKDIDMKADSFFRIYSMTKVITSVGIMMLFEDGLLDEIAPILRGNARAAQKVANHIKTYLTKEKRKNFTKKDWEVLKDSLGILPLGLSPIELQVLKMDL